MSIRPISSNVDEVGKTIKSTKKKYTWKMEMDGKHICIEFFNSVITGKKKILQNGQVIYENNQHSGAFHFPFTIGKHSLSLVQHGDNFELRINNNSF